MTARFAATATILVAAGVASAAVYDYAADFSLTGGNPNGAWSYGAKHKDADGKPTGEFQPFDTAVDEGWILHWYMTDNAGGTFGGETWKNMTGGWQFNVAPGHCSLNGDAYCTSTARWTAPNSGMIDLSVSFGLSASARMIMHNGDILQELPAGGPNAFEALGMWVAAGDTIDVTCYGAGAYGNTMTDIVIIPAPASMVLASAVLGAASGRRRRT
ncbi:MAG: hypothetical protein L6Q35_04705 [Phycisphaerales bacterium]|nr:hypothetical protein [Phycisphaerales bacterium]